jgi:hypothetical protein
MNWRSRKFWLFAASFTAMLVAGFLGKLTYEFIAGLLALPSAYGLLNLKEKRVTIQDVVLENLAGEDDT